MPLYEYQCDCGYKFDAWNKVANRETATCTKCGNRAKKKLSVVNNTFGFTRKNFSGVNDELIRDV